MTKMYHPESTRHRISRHTIKIGIDVDLAGLKPELDRMDYHTRVYGDISEEETHRRLLSDRVHFFVTRRGGWFFASFYSQYSVLDIKVGYEPIGLARVLDKILRQKIDQPHLRRIVGTYLRVTQDLVNTLDQENLVGRIQRILDVLREAMVDGKQSQLQCVSDASRETAFGEHMCREIARAIGKPDHWTPEVERLLRTVPWMRDSTLITTTFSNRAAALTEAMREACPAAQPQVLYAKNQVEGF